MHFSDTWNKCPTLWLLYLSIISIMFDVFADHRNNLLIQMCRVEFFIIFHILYFFFNTVITYIICKVGLYIYIYIYISGGPLSALTWDSSRPNPTKKLGENPVPFHSRKNDSHSLPLPCWAFFFFFLPITVNYSKNIVGYRSQIGHLISWIKTQNVVFCYYIELKAILCTVLHRFNFM